MLIREVAVRNFKAFHSDHVVKFAAPSGSRNVYLIGALNGSGKTSLVQAVQLALYGRFAAGLPAMFAGGRDHRRRYEGWLSACFNRRAASDNADHMAVRIVVQHDDRLLTISRTYWFKPDGAYDEESLTLVEDGPDGGLTMQDEDAQSRLALLLPRHLADLAFFDGERVRALDGGEATGWLTTAVDHLLHLEPITKVRSDLDRLSRDRRALTATEAQLNARNSLETQIEAATSALAENAVRQSEALERLREIEADQDRHDDEIASALSGGRPITSAQVEVEVADLIRRRDELRSRFGRYVGDWLYFDLAASLVEKTGLLASSEAASRDSRHRRKLEADAVAAFADRVASDGDVTALVGSRRIGKLTERLHQLQDEIAPVDESGPVLTWVALFAEAELQEIVAHSESMSSRDHAEVEHLAQDLVHVNERLVELANLRTTLEAHAGLEHVIRRRDELSTMAGVARREVEELAAEEADLKTQLSTLRQALSQLDATLADAGDAARWLTSASDVSAGLEIYVQERRRSAFQAIGEGVLTWLNAMLRKRRLVDAVEIDPRTHAIVLRDAEARRIALPSAGEQQLAAFAFAATMLDLAEESLPFFIDTPLARLDGPHRERFATQFAPKLDRQVFILSTDEEVDNTLLRLLQPHVVETYLIEHDERDGTSHVEAGQYLPVDAA